MLYFFFNNMFVFYYIFINVLFLLGFDILLLLSRHEFSYLCRSIRISNKKILVNEDSKYRVVLIRLLLV